MEINWQFDQSDINWGELQELYRAARLSEKPPDFLETVFSNSRFKCFVFDGDRLIGAGRALADGKDCSYIGDVALHPDYQGIGLGKQIIQYLIDQSKGYRKIILYANPGKEGFYAKFGFLKMNTAMAIFQNEDEMIEKGALSPFVE